MSTFSGSMCKCAGIILLKKIGDEYHFALVETRQKKFKYSFPKGKREINEDVLTTAKRETYEETGITDDQYTFIPDIYYLEYLKVGNYSRPHIIYFVATLKDDNTDIHPIDENEILSSLWVSEKDIKNMTFDLTFQRRNIMLRLYKKLKPPL